MTTATIQSVNLLPVYFQTDKNAKFLSSTIDQLIQPVQLERLNGYIGSTSTPTYLVGDRYITETDPLRQAYQLEPALITYDSNSDINTVVAIDDLANEIKTEGGYSNNFDRLFRSQLYSYSPHIDWDKLINYQNYFWLPVGSYLVNIEQDYLDVENEIIGQPAYTITSNGTSVPLLNGMLIGFNGKGIDPKYLYKEFFVEGTGTSIVLVPYDDLITPEKLAQYDPDFFDTKGFDEYSFDNDRNIPITPEYITINRASKDSNPWSRYNRWISKDVIISSSLINNEPVQLLAEQIAKRPIIEFNANIQLYNFGSIAIKSVDLLETNETDALKYIDGTAMVGTTSISTKMIDGVYLEYGQRVIFASDINPQVRNKIFQIDIERIGNSYKLVLLPTLDSVPFNGANVLVTKGNTYSGTSWWYNGSDWAGAQQRTVLNSGPLFDLFDSNGISFGNQNYYLSNFGGNRIFGYSINATNALDSVLKLHLDYRNINAVGSFLFKNYYGTDIIDVSTNNIQTVQIPTNTTNLKINGSLANIWGDQLFPVLAVNNSTGYYDIPLSLTNNPLNGVIDTFSFSDLTDHAASKTRLIANATPISFAMMFIGKKENSVIDAISKSSSLYNYFKLTLLNQVSTVSNDLNPAVALDEILANININKTAQSSYYLSDMVPYGANKKVLMYTVSNLTNGYYALSSEFSLSKMSTLGVLVYLNGVQLTANTDYTFDPVDAYVIISSTTQLNIGDTIRIDEFQNTNGSFVPPTPTKLGLYPAFMPKIYLDDTYASGPVNVIQGHDGSIMIAFNDYRDAIILEYELRVYNNLKVSYRAELFDINISNPGKFRDAAGISNYSVSEIKSLLGQDFIKWANSYGIDYTTNNTYDAKKPFTWNYKTVSYTSSGDIGSGNWRGIYNYYYDTDRPHTCPWEMLGFSEMPDWWIDEYGPVPYTTGNFIMWSDLQDGRIARGPRKGINSLYRRPGLLDIIPVDSTGLLLDPITIGIVHTPEPSEIRQNWEIGDLSPSETAWRRSSFWPFAVQRLLALTKPSTYASLMYDPANISLNNPGQWVYGTKKDFLQLSKMPVHGENGIATSGYSMLVSEIGQQRSHDYISQLRQDLTAASFNLFYKAGGFVSKNTLQIIIDAFSPTTNDPGAILPNESYSLILNTSNPVENISISGIVIQRLNGGFVIRGYDQDNPYFNYYAPIRNTNTPFITIGGVSTPYVSWKAASSVGSTGLKSLDVTTAKASSSNTFYQKGQIVQYGNSFYRVLTSHQSEAAFNNSLFQILDSLPSSGGATVQIAQKFSSEISRITYGTIFNNIQEVYDLIIGYGKWLTAQGFTFNQYNKELGITIDWSLSAKEFLYWSTQNWNDNSVITLSPFADQVVFKYSSSIVNDVFDPFYNYSISKADGSAFEQNNLFITREDGEFKINVINSDDGIYFVRLHSIQKEHGMVFNNKTIFGDVIYDITTGERQRRVKLVGFRTANWNGDFSSPGFVFDEATIKPWQPYTNYIASDIVKFSGLYYSAIRNVTGGESFVFNQWNRLSSKPTAGLLPNFDYKISQFNDFYSLDTDNFDEGQQQAAQNLTGYVPRTYLNNIFTDPIAQYKFYQGYIKEKGTLNSISKLAKASIKNLKSEVGYNEEWAFRVGQYGSFTTNEEYEVPLIEGTFLENPQIISFVRSVGNTSDNLIYYITPEQLSVAPTIGQIPAILTTSTSAGVFQLINAGYAQLGDVTGTAFNQRSILDIANNHKIAEYSTIWLGYEPISGWNIYRYELSNVSVVSAVSDTILNTVTFTTSDEHNFQENQVVSIVNYNKNLDGIYLIKSIDHKEFTVSSNLGFLDLTPSGQIGLIYTFNNARFDVFDNIPEDSKLFKYPLGTFVWVDSGNGTKNNGWAAYEKVNNYSHKFYASSVGNPPFEGLGYSISRRSGSNILVSGAPIYDYTPVYGERVTGNVIIYEEIDGVFSPFLQYQLPGVGNELGYSVVYDDTRFNNTSTYGLIFAGAPGFSNNSGTVIVSSINHVYDQKTELYLYNPVPASTNRFGSSLFVQRNTAIKKVLVGAPAANVGNVYSYVLTSSSGVISVTSRSEIVFRYGDNTTLMQGAEWGYAISGSDNAAYYAISAPGQGDGVVAIFVNGVQVQSLGTDPTNSPIGCRFGHSLAMSYDGAYLAIGEINRLNNNNSLGTVLIYTLTNSYYVLDQKLTNPIPGVNMNFGAALDFNNLSNKLVITAIGTDTSIRTTLDDIGTTFDSGTTTFNETIEKSGTAYLYARRGSRFVYSAEITTSTVYDSLRSSQNITGTNYGTCVSIEDDYVFVGAPSISATSSSGVHQYITVDPNVIGWKQSRVQDELVIPGVVEKISLIDAVADDVINYYDYVDPLKGKILGIAEQELTHKTSNDPATYSIGTDTVSVSTNINWLEDHVGELWWDLSTARFIWYEQDSLVYRRSNWGKLFPGSSIDVYEWVESPLLPSDWAIKADTTLGLAQGISGQPRYPDNTVLSVRQVYDPVSGGFGNLYYYWVRNKTTVPNIKNRRISGYNVARYIENPTTAGIQYAAILSSNSLMLANLGSELLSNQVGLNINLDNTQSKVPRHTEWTLIKEGVASSIIPPILEKKMIDSLIGRDSLGNAVPDPRLSARSKYGIGIRPQQTLLKNRYEALHNIVEFVNAILIDVQVTGNYNLDKLKQQEPAPTEYKTVEDTTELAYINVGTSKIVTVLSDSANNGKWAVYQLINGIWEKTRSASYDVPLYWKYVDWVSPDFNYYTHLAATVESAYLLSEITLTPGQYVKVNNRGDGNYIILEKLIDGTQGTYGINFDLLYIKNGTIQLLDTLWDQYFGWDQVQSFNQTLFDQGPDLELDYILSALKDDIFINDLKVNWNKLFFKVVKYAFTEQKSIDWAFKTSFIDVTNNAGALTQPPVYKLQDSAYYEDYINEVKPYHTHIRKFTTKFNNIEPSNTTVSDFDFPGYFNTLTQVFTTASVSATDVTAVPARTISTKIVFDRISTYNDMGNMLVTDYFTANNVKNKFTLSWLAQPNKSKISVYFNNVLVLPTEYTIKSYTRSYQNYNKKYSDLYFLNNSPSTGTLSINYQKSVELMTAGERIFKFYSPTDGMPAKSLEQLMVGAVDPRLTFGGQYEGKGFTNLFGGDDPDTYINSDANYSTWNTSGLINATGINPADISIDGGSSFISTHTGVAPEEVVPGYAADTLGINVYTKPSTEVPVIVNGYFSIYPGSKDISTASWWRTNLKLPILPPTKDSIIVSMNGLPLIYDDFGTQNQETYSVPNNRYYVDYEKSLLIVSSSIVFQPGILSYSIITVGDSDPDGVGIVDKQFAPFVGTETDIQVLSRVDFGTVGSVYVTVNGIPISTSNQDYNSQTNLGAATYYTLAQYGFSNAAVVDVHNLPAKGGGVQVWYFNKSHPLFNKITDVSYQAGKVGNGNSTFTIDTNGYMSGPTLLFPPNTNGPISSQVIVEYSVAGSTNAQILMPPSVVYYSVTTTNTTTYQALNLNGTFTTISTVTNFVTIDNINVYHNGKSLIAGKDFIINTDDSVTVFGTSTYVFGDTIAVESLAFNDISVSKANTTTTYTYDYMITPQGQLLLTPKYAKLYNYTIKVISFGNQDQLDMKLKVFYGNPRRSYRLDQPVLNEKYLWVAYNDNQGRRINLTSGNDFILLPDKMTVLINNAYSISANNKVFIRSFASPKVPDGIMGYRYFDGFNSNVSYTRLSNKNSTYLTRPLAFTDTEIYVADPTVLSPPNDEANSPGIVLIAGERIEFFDIGITTATNSTGVVTQYSVLRQLRRATQGTSPNFYSKIGTNVIDQGIHQIVPISIGTPYNDVVLVQNTYTPANLNNTYVISTSTILGWINSITSTSTTDYHYNHNHSIRCDGITLMTRLGELPIDPYTGIYTTNNQKVYSVSTASIRAEDQVHVYYGGYPLFKDERYYHDTKIAYDGISVDQIVGTVPTVSALANVPIYLGNAYLVTSTNQVWVCTNGRFEVDHVNNYVDSGLRRIPADFSINANTQLLTLNTETVTLNTGTLLTIVKKQVAFSWNDIDPINTMTNTLSLLNSTSTMAQFLKHSPAALPTSYFYGSDSNNFLFDSNGTPLLDQNGRPLQGL